jgi:bifunctional DNA-binding transcriptional regulator/antitoxin component of YhaV-PrlF toxin-antitoxin module
MAVVIVSPKYHVTIPQQLRQKIGLQAGDVLEAKVERGKMTLARRPPISEGVVPEGVVPEGVVPEGIEESLADFRAGRVHGPFKTARGAVTSMTRELRKRKT